MHVDIFILIDRPLAAALLESGHSLKYILVPASKGGGTGIHETVGWLMAANKEGVRIDDDVRQ